MAMKIFELKNSIQLLKVISLGVLALLFLETVYAQPGVEPVAPVRGPANGSSFSLSDIENINLTSGNLMLNMPLVSTPLFRGGMSGSLGLMYNSKLHDTIILEQMNSSNEITHQHFLKVAEEGGWKTYSSLDYRLKVTDRFEPGISIPCEPGIGANYGKNAARWKVQMVFPDGSEKDFLPVGYTDPYGDGYYRITPNGYLLTSSYTEFSNPPSAACNTTSSLQTTDPMVYYSTDGSYTRLVVDHDSAQENFTGARITSRYISLMAANTKRRMQGLQTETAIT